MKLSTRYLPLFRKISKRDQPNEAQIIREMKECVKKDPAVIKKFKEYGVPIDKIDDIHVEFADLDVSAKTKDQKIYINRSMLDPDSKIKDPTPYLAHELTHVLQQMTGNTEGHKATDDYLHKPTEQEAFKVQVEFKERNEGEEEANDYVESLLDHHDKGGKERKELKKILKDEG